MKLVKKVWPAHLPPGKSSTTTGTKAIDRTCETLDAVVPNQLITKKGHEINPLLGYGPTVSITTTKMASMEEPIGVTREERGSNHVGDYLSRVATDSLGVMRVK